VFCIEQLGELRNKKDAFIKAGAQVVVIGQGDADLVKEVCVENGAWYHCVGDPERESFFKYGLGYTEYSDLVTERVKTGSKRARGSGYKQNWSRTFALDSDWLQLPGACVIDTKGVVRHMERALDVSYQADVAKIIETVIAIKKN
jgi:peroxiredoxin